MPTHPGKKGGRIPPDGRQAQAKGVGKNAKRHDLERPATPGLHDSSLQKGDVQALEQGQRIAPPGTQQPAIQGRPQTQETPNRRQSGGSGGGVEVPDAIEFLGQRQGPEFNPPQARRRIDESRAQTWLPVLRELASGPGASAKLVNAFINQARLMSQAGGQPASIVDMGATDDGIEEMLNRGIGRSE